MALPWLDATAAALNRAKRPILWAAAMHVVSLALGIAMVHAGNAFALGHRDVLAGAAITNDLAAKVMKGGLRVRAALLDSSRNLCLGAIPSTIKGLSVALPFPLTAYRGWAGGIVSVDGKHRSRLAPGREGWYYLSVVLLQLT
jgi:hypothetical protein